jgi:hypothetical protein
MMFYDRSDSGPPHSTLLRLPGDFTSTIGEITGLPTVSTLREVVLRGVTELAWQQVLAMTGFLFALGVCSRLETRTIQDQPWKRDRPRKAGTPLPSPLAP